MKFKLALTIAIALAGQVLAQDSTNVRTIGYYDTPGIACAISIHDELSYVADMFEGLCIIDVSNPANPFQSGYLDSLSNWVVGLVVSNGYAYLSDQQMGFRIIDVSNPSSPFEVGSCYANGTIGGLSVSGDYAYVAEYDSGVRIINTSDPANPNEINLYDTPGSAIDIVVRNSFAYVADYGSGLRIINISNPLAPTEIGFYTDSEIRGVTVSGHYAYLAHFGFQIVDLSDPANPIGLGYNNDCYNAVSVAVQGNLAYVADMGYGIHILNISDPNNPIEVGYYNTPGCAWDVALCGPNILVADDASGLRIYQGYGPAGVEAGQGSQATLKVESLKLKVAGSRIEYQLPMNGNATIKIYNLLGQEVCCLLNGDAAAGQHRMAWNKSGVSSGVYLVRLSSGGEAATAKMLVVR